MPRSLLAPFVVADSNIIETLASRVDRRFAAASLSIALNEPPIALPRLAAGMRRQRRVDDHPATIWLCDRVTQVSTLPDTIGGSDTATSLLAIFPLGRSTRCRCIETEDGSEHAGLATCATDWIGGAVARRLASAGHKVVGLTHSDASAAKLANQGYTEVHGDTDAASIAEAASGIDVVVHATSPDDQNTAAYD